MLDERGDKRLIDRVSVRLQLLNRQSHINFSRTIAEIWHGMYRANTEELRNRRRGFLDELKATVPIQPVTAATAETIARIGGEQAAQRINLPLADLIIGATAVELGYAIATSNLRDFNRIPGLRVVQL